MRQRNGRHGAPRRVPRKLRCRHPWASRVAFVIAACAVPFGCGGKTLDAGPGASSDASLSSSASSPEDGPRHGGTAVGEGTGGSAVGEGTGGSGIGEGTGGSAVGEGGAGDSGSTPASAECALPDGFARSDFVVMTFANHTSGTLYLASTNEHCGAWPAHVEFRRDGALVDVYEGDCVPYCTSVAQSGYPEAEAEVRGCAGPTPCPTPLRAIPAGGEIAQFVFPWTATHHRLPSSCISSAQGPDVECLTTHDLPRGTYSLRATAYTSLSCGSVSCNCDPGQSAGWCTSPDAARQPVGTGAALSVDTSLELGPYSGATFAFGD